MSDSNLHGEGAPCARCVGLALEIGPNLIGAVVDDQRRVMCGDRVLADQWTGVVAAQHGPFSWVVIDGINVPQTHATITLRPVDNDHAE